MNYFQDIIKKNCDYYELDTKLVWCLIQLESGWNPWAIRYEPGYNYTYQYPVLNVKISKATKLYIQKCSYGLMQVMGNHYYERKHKGFCTELFNIDINIGIGCHILHTHKHKNGNNPYDLYAAYNAGSLRKYNGEYSNYLNVNKFKKIYDSDQFELALKSFPVEFKRNFLSKTP